MSADFKIAKSLTKDIEGGWWNDNAPGGGGYTYAGVAYKFYPKWPGWNRILQLAVKKYGSLAKIPRYTVFNDSLLDEYVSSFYKENFWQKIMQGDKFKNQETANLIYDFIVHKQYDAVAAINYTARLINKSVKTSKTKLHDEVINIANVLQDQFYEKLRYNRRSYYISPKSIPDTTTKSFSSSLVKAFLKRTDRFPETIKSQSTFTWLNNPFKFIS